MIGLTLVLLLGGLGALFMLLAGIGILRMPDLYCRTSAVTKAATLGVGCLLVSVAIAFGELQITARVLAIIAFLLLTAPIGAQAITRAAYFHGVPLWEGTSIDERKDYSRKANEDEGSYEEVPTPKPHA